MGNREIFNTLKTVYNLNISSELDEILGIILNFKTLHLEEELWYFQEFCKKSYIAKNDFSMTVGIELLAACKNPKLYSSFRIYSDIKDVLFKVLETNFGVTVKDNITYSSLYKTDYRFHIQLIKNSLERYIKDKYNTKGLMYLIHDGKNESYIEVNSKKEIILNKKKLEYINIKIPVIAPSYMYTLGKLDVEKINEIEDFTDSIIIDFDKIEDIDDKYIVGEAGI